MTLKFKEMPVKKTDLYFRQKEFKILDGCKVVGFIKIGWADFERKNVFYYLSRFTGASYVNPFEDENDVIQNPLNFDRKTKLYILSSRPSSPLWNVWKEAKDNLSDEEIDRLLEKFWKKLEKETKPHYQKDLDFHSNPYVSYICIEKEYRMKGLSVKLYRKAAEWCKKELGKNFYASNLQSPEAKGAWKSLERKGLVGKDNRGRYFKLETQKELVSS